MNELKPCPFCGGKAEERYRWFEAKLVLSVECPICNARKAISIYDDNATGEKVKETMRYAYEAWNKRVNL